MSEPPIQIAILFKYILDSTIEVIGRPRHRIVDSRSGQFPWIDFEFARHLLETTRLFLVQMYGKRHYVLPASDYRVLHRK